MITGERDPQELRQGARADRERLTDEYWRDLDVRREYPEEFVRAMTQTRYLAALIPEEYGGVGLDLRAACAVFEEANRSGANADPARMYVTGALLRHGFEEQKKEHLPTIARKELRLQAFGVTGREAGTDKIRISTFAERREDRYVVNGRKICISRVQHSDLMILLARTTPVEEVRRRSHGLAVFIADLRGIAGESLEVKRRRVMVTNEPRFIDVEVPAHNLIGEEGEGFRYILAGMNAERILIADDGHFSIDGVTRRANKREFFGPRIGQNQQGAYAPIARAYAHVEAAGLTVQKAATLFDKGEKRGAEANMAKLLAADASWEAANVVMQTFGRYGVDNEYDVERKFWETRLYQVAAISTNLIPCPVAKHLLKIPRSF